VRWVFISHNDIDHAGNLHQVIDACPQATSITTWFPCERLGLGGLGMLPTRWVGR
jgi:flavorubredoxin